jgi:hypothetical protein
MFLDLVNGNKVYRVGQFGMAGGPVGVVESR